MGISAACHRFLLQAHKNAKFSGTLVTLGRQDIWISADDFNNTATQLGSDLRASDKRYPDRIPSNYFSKNWMDDRSYFESLGFSSYKSLDADAYEGADIIFDLGHDDLPDNLAASCDVVIDIGVIEHCFDIPAAFRNIFKLLKVGGRAIFFNPTIQQIDASFYFFQPTLFYDYFKANDWRIDRICIYAFPPNKWHNDECNMIVEYEPGLFDLHAFGLDGRRHGLHTVVTKRANSTFDKIPNQRRYKETWQMTQVMPELSRILQTNHSAVAMIASMLDQDTLSRVARMRAMQDAIAGQPAAPFRSRLKRLVRKAVDLAIPR